MYKKTVTFIAIFIIIFYIVQLWLTPNWNYPQFIENTGLNILEMNNIKSDPSCFFVGTSHMEFSVSPMDLYSNYGVVTYNAATSGQPIIVSKYIVTKIFENGYKPKAIIIDPGSLFIDEISSNGFRYVADAEILDRTKIKLIQEYMHLVSYEKQDFLSLMGSNSLKDMLSLYLPFYRYHTRWDSLNSDDYQKLYNDYYFSQGYFVVPHIAAAWDDNRDDVDYIAQSIIEDQDNNITYYSDNSGEVTINEGIFYNTEVLEKNKKYLYDIYEICKANNCDLVLVKNPVINNAANYSSSWTSYRYESVKKVASELGIPYVDLNYDVDIGIDWMHDTRDRGNHLNLLGAEKVTDFLGSYLTWNYDLQQIKSEEYDQKLELYNKYTEIARIELSFQLLDYIERIKNSDHELEVIISARDDMRTSLSQSEIEALRSLGLQTDFENMEYSDSFIAVIDDGAVEYEGVSNRQQHYETEIGHDSVSITSAGYHDGNTSSILINGQEYSMNQRGINIVVYDKESGLVVDRATCDTWAPEHEVVHDVGNLLFEYQEYLLGRK